MGPFNRTDATSTDLYDPRGPRSSAVRAPDFYSGRRRFDSSRGYRATGFVRSTLPGKGNRAKPILASLVPEVPAAREDHRRAALVHRGDDLIVALRAARLDDRGHARVERAERAVREREERIRCNGGALERALFALEGIARLLDGDAHRVHAAHLPCAD